MIQQISVAEFRRRMPVGTKCASQHVSGTLADAQQVAVQMTPERYGREIVKQTASQMEITLDPPRADRQNSWLQYKGAKAFCVTLDGSERFILLFDEGGEYALVYVPEPA